MKTQQELIDGIATLQVACSEAGYAFFCTASNGDNNVLQSWRGDSARLLGLLEFAKTKIYYDIQRANTD